MLLREEAHLIHGVQLDAVQVGLHLLARLQGCLAPHLALVLLKYVVLLRT